MQAGGNVNEVWYVHRGQRHHGVILLFDVLPLQLSGTMRNTRGQGLGILNVTSYIHVLTSH